MEGGKELRVCGREKKNICGEGKGAGNILSGPVGDLFGIMFELFWDCCGINLGSFWHQFGNVLG